MKKLIFTLISLIGCVITIMADCPPAATSSSNVVLTQRVAKVGMLNGEFSIGGGKKVSFSQGNLQYQASTNTWRFAENQWDAFGGTGSNNNTPLATVSGNNTAQENRASQELWIDLFGWATSGNSGATSEGGNYQPWTSLSSGQYGPLITNAVWTDNADEADWGLANAGQLGAEWRVLTRQEWLNLFARKNSDDAYLFAFGSISAASGTIKGLILLPDDWRQAKSAVSRKLTLGGSAYYTSNPLTLAQWNVLEKEGAVFLPAVGYRSGTNVVYANVWGQYWTSYASSSTTTAYYFRLKENTAPSASFTSDSRYVGCAVRLIHEL